MTTCETTLQMLKVMEADGQDPSFTRAAGNEALPHRPPFGVPQATASMVDCR